MENLVIGTSGIFNTGYVITMANTEFSYIGERQTVAPFEVMGLQLRSEAGLAPCHAHNLTLPRL